MNSCAFRRFPLKEGQVPKRLLGEVAIIGGSVGGSGGVGGSGVGDLGWSTCISSRSGCSDASMKSSLKGSGSSLGSLGGSVSIGSPCPDKDSPVKGLNIEDVPVRSLESSSC